MIYKIFAKHTSLFILGALFSCTLLMSYVHDRCTLTSVYLFLKSWLTLSASTLQMVKHTQTIRRLLPMNYLSVFDHFVGLALKGLRLCQAV